jgi:Kef-type K+ transport system membrane component KefB
MTDQEVQLFLADLAIIILLARLLGMAAKRLGQPPVLGEIIAGILLGPTLFRGEITATLFPITLRPALSALANLGVVMFMFAVGYVLDLRLIRRGERVAASVSVCWIILPLSLGTGLGAWLAGRHHVHQVLPFALFVGTAMSVTAFPVLARILIDRGMDRTWIGGIALASAAIDDALAWSLLAVVVALAGAGGQQFRLLLAPVYAGVMFGLVRPLLRRVVDGYQRRGQRTPSVLAAVLAGLLLSSYATAWMGVRPIFGAFLFGVVMPREGAAAALREEILGRLEQVSVLVLLPVFFVVSGAERQPVVGRPVRARGTLPHPAGRRRRQVRRRLRRRPPRRGSRPACRGPRHPDEHPWAHRDRDPFGWPAAAHPGSVALLADDRDGGRDDDDGRAAAAFHRPGSRRSARHRGGGPCRPRDRRGAPDPGAGRGAGDRRSAR